MIKIKHSGALLLIFCFLFAGRINPAQAQPFSYQEDSDNSRQDYVLASPDKIVDFKIYQDSAHPSHNIKFMQLAAADQISSYFSYDGSLQPASDLYLIRIPQFAPENFNQDPLISIKFETSSSIRGAYYYDWNSLKFVKLETLMDATSSLASFDWPDREELIFALFKDQELVGKASWYTHPRYRNEFIAASVDFPKNTKLKVINLSNNKAVIVTVKDYGPDKSVHPDRVVDLSKPAFKVLSPLGAGVIKVKVVKINK